MTGKVQGIAKGSYGWSANLLEQALPAPQPLRQVNPYLAAGLELLGYIGILGLGRIYAGDTAGGIRSLVVWLCAYFGFISVILTSGLLAAFSAIFTLGVSIMVWALFILPLTIPFLLAPAGAAAKLFVVLNRS